MKTTAQKIRALAPKKTVVHMTRRRRSKSGFIVISPEGISQHFPTRNEAEQNLFAQMRCHRINRWLLATKEAE